jgi:hypothetical protein
VSSVVERTCINEEEPHDLREPEEREKPIRAAQKVPKLAAK